jgi:hypothetical protein
MEVRLHIFSTFIPVERNAFNHGKEADWTPELFSYHENISDVPVE